MSVSPDYPAAPFAPGTAPAPLAAEPGRPFLRYDAVRRGAPRQPFPRQATLAWVLLLVLLALGAGIAAIAYFAAVADPDTDGAAAARRVALHAPGRAVQGPALPPPPPVEPVKLLDVSRETAEKLNAAMPFSRDPNPPAAALDLQLAPMDEALAVDCLAAAVWYEAGDDMVGQQAVAQVVLNRMRHRAFPKTVCGVVFQGAERNTGCQFSFACDGSMTRRAPGAAAWGRARTAAMTAMHGLVFGSVGWATHYHTDWVVPNWNSDVEKIAQVGTHLFFRWPGANGRAIAFRNAHGGSEPVIAQLARLSPAHAGTLQLRPDDPAGSVNPAAPAPTGAAAARGTSPPVSLRGNVVAGTDQANVFVMQIKPDQFPGTLALVALDICRTHDKGCTVVGFLDRPGHVARSALGHLTWSDRRPDFYYYSDRSRSRETAYWNCTSLPRDDKTQCLPTDFTPEG